MRCATWASSLHSWFTPTPCTNRFRRNRVVLPETLAFTGDDPRGHVPLEGNREGFPRAGLAMLMTEPWNFACAVRGLLLGTTLAACSEAQTIDSFPDEFVGVGLELTMKRNVPVVVRTLENGPAHVAGLQRGDRIVGIDGDPTWAQSLGDVVMALRGPPESQVTVEVERAELRIILVMRRATLAKVGAQDYAARGTGVADSKPRLAPPP